MKRILQLSTYPIAHPNHGGQIRVDAIRALLLYKGFEVYNYSISEAGHDHYSENDMIISREEIDKVVQTPFCGDLATAILSATGIYFNFIKQKIESVNPDAIFLEQPWLWPAVDRYIKEDSSKKNIKIIYSSQNIEYKTKQNILLDHGIDNKDLVSKIYEIELDLCKHSNLAIGVSDNDAQELNLMGSRNTIVAANGVRNIETSGANDFVLSKALSGRKFALFVGSAYPPNAMGFWRMVNHSLSFLREDEFIAIAGGVSDILMPYGEIYSGVRFQHNRSKVVLFGKISNDLLDRLIRAASAIILPITSGGGSNLKTAEAIASHKSVVATNTACRGYGEIIDRLTNFHVVGDNEPDYFVAALSEVLSQPDREINLSTEELSLRDSVLWPNTLASITNAIERL